MRFSIKSWLSASIGHRIRFYALILTTLIIIFFGAVSYLALRVTISNNVQQKLNNESQQLSRFFSLMLNGIAKDVVDLSQNSFIANGLADSTGKELYLIPFLRDHENPLNIPVNIVLVDFQGNPVAANKTEYFKNYQLNNEIKHSLELGQNIATVLGEAMNRQELLFITPIIFPPTQQVEGPWLSK